MSVRRIKNHGTWVWQARVAYRRFRKAAFRNSKEEAREAEALLLQELKSRAGEAESQATRLATMKDLFEFYVGDLQARGKGPDAKPAIENVSFVVDREGIMEIVEFKFKHEYLPGLAPFTTDYNPHTDKPNHCEYSLR